MTIPNEYQVFNQQEWKTYKGKLSGSSQPGYHERNEADISKLKILEENEYMTAEQAGVDKTLIDHLDGLYAEGVRTIYSLAKSFSGIDRHPRLLKHIWETRFKDRDLDNPTQYVTEIDGDSTALTKAVRLNKPVILGILIEKHHADPNFINRDGENPLMYAYSDAVTDCLKKGGAKEIETPKITRKIPVYFKKTLRRT